MATIKWIAGNGSWTTASDWSPATVPGSSDDALINASGSYTVTLGVPITVNSIAISDSSATLAANDSGQTETVTVGLTNGGNLLLDSSGGQGGTALSIGGTLTNSNYVAIGNASLSAATKVTANALSNTGRIDITGGGANQASLSIATAAPSIWTGTLNISGDGLLKFSGTTGISSISGGAYIGLFGSQAVLAAAGLGTTSSTALSALTTIASNGELDVRNGAVVSLASLASDAGLLNFENNETVTIGGALNLAPSGRLKADAYDNAAGGSQITINGDLTNGTYNSFGDGGVSLGNSNLTNSSSLTVEGAFANTGGTLNVTGGRSGSAATMMVTGAVQSTLTGNYWIVANSGAATVQWGSGGITQIGDGASHAGDLYIDGANALAEVGTAGTDNVVTGLTTIANNGELDARDGTLVSLPNLTSDAGLLNFENNETVTIGGPLNLAPSGRIKVDTYDNASGGSQITITGDLTNGTYNSFGDGGVSVGNNNLTGTSKLTVQGSFINTGGTLNVSGGRSGSAATMMVTGAVQSTLTGNYWIVANSGAATVQWGSGGITQIGDGASHPGDLYVDGANALAEIGNAGTDNVVSGLTTITNNGTLDLRNGTLASLPNLTSDAGLLNFENNETVTIGGPLSLAPSGRIKVDTYDNASGGSQITIGGDLTNGTYNSFGDGGVSVGNGNLTKSSMLTVEGTFTNTGGLLNISGGRSGSAADMVVTGAVQSTLTGNYQVVANSGSAELQWGSGGITQIGDGASNAGDLYVDGANALAEVGNAGSDNVVSGLTTIANNGTLDLRNGTLASLPNLTSDAGLLNFENNETVTIGGPLSLAPSGRIKVDTYDNASGGSQITIGGDLTNGTYNSFGDGGVSVGNGNLTGTSKLTVQGSFTNTGGTLNVSGGRSGSAATMMVTGAVQSTLTGNYYLVANSGAATVQWGSGGITQIGDGASNAADLYVDGANAFVEVGATNSNSALSGLTTIASNGLLDLRDATQVTTNSAVTISGGGRLKVDAYGNASGGSQITVNGDLTNGTYNSFGDGGVSVGNGNLTGTSKLTVQGSFTNTGGTLNVTGGLSGSAATMMVTGAVQSTLTGNYWIVANSGSATVQWGSGSINQIGDGASHAADLYVDGANALAEVGAAGTDNVVSTLTTIANNGELDLRDGTVVSLSNLATDAGLLNFENNETVTIGTSLNLQPSGRLKVDTYDNASGGSQITINGNLTNGTYNSFGDGGVSVGNGNLTKSSTLTVEGTFTNTGGLLNISGGRSGSAADMVVTGAVQSTLTGNYQVVANSGSAELQWGSGGITQIGDGASNAGDLYVDGANALAEVGNAGSDNVVSGLTTIANNGTLDLRDGTVVSLSNLATDAGLLNFENNETVTIGSSLNLAPGGRIKVDTYDNASGGSQITITGNLTNGTYNSFGDGGISVGNSNLKTASRLSVTGTLNNIGLVVLIGASNAAATLTAGGGVSTSGTVNINSFSTLSVTGGNAFTETGGTTTVTGTLAAATLNVNGGLLDFTGALSAGSGTGDINIGGNGTAEFAGAVDAGHRVTFTSAAGTLELGAPNQFAPTIYGFTDGDTLDLLQAAVTSVSYSNGVLTLLNGGTTVATLNLTGPYFTSDFAIGSDHNGGTDIKLGTSPAQATIQKTSVAGTFTQNGNNYTLDFGTVKLGTNALTADLEVLNSAIAPADTLSGSFSIAANAAFTNGGFTAFSGVAPAQADTAPTITFNTGSGGTFTETITLMPASSNGNGTASLPNETLTVTGTVAPPPAIVAPSNVVVQQGRRSRIAGVSVTDVYAQNTGQAVTVILGDTNGLLSANTNASGGGGNIAGNGTSQLTIQGTLAQVNADLGTLTDLDSVLAPDAITINANDGSAAAPTQTLSVGVAISPVITTPFVAVVPQGQATPVLGIGISDVSPANKTFTVTLADTYGRLSANANAAGGGGTIKGCGSPCRN